MSADARTATSRRSGNPTARSRRLLAVAAVGVLGLTACSSGSTDSASSGGNGDSAESAKLALVPGGPNVYFAPWEESASGAESEFGIDQVDYVVPPTQTFETAVQVSTLNSLASQGYNGLAVFPNGATAMQPTYQRISDRGVSIIDLAGCTQQPTPALFCLATDVTAAAKQQTELVIEEMGGEGNIVFLAGQPTDANTVQRQAGIEEAIAETNGAVTLLQVVSNIDSPTEAAPAIQSLLAGSADQIDGIISTSYYPSVAGAEIWSNNPQYQDIVFAAADAAPEVMAAVEAGAIFGTMWQNSSGQGTVAAFMLNEIVTKGCTVNESGPWTKTALTDRLIDSGYTFVTQENVGQYAGKTYGLPDITEELLQKAPEYLTCQ